MTIIRALFVSAVLVAFAPPVLSAETYDPTPLTAAEIFAHAQAAYGTFDVNAHTETQLTHTPYADWTYVTVAKGANSATTVTGGGFTHAYGIYQKQAWSEDTNGTVILRSQFHSKEDPNVLALAHPEDPKYGVRVLGITQAAPKQYVVEIDPPGGYDEYRYYDANTWLLSQIVSYTRDRYKHVTDYGDYRKTFGRMVPYRVHSYDGRSDNDTVTTVESFVDTASDAGLAIPPGRALYTYDGTAPLTLPATFTPGGILLHAQVGGRGLDFLLDSGSSTLTLDPGVAHQLGLAPYGRQTQTIGGGDVEYGRVRIPKMTIGGLALNGAVFDTVPFDAQVGNARAVGLIGFDFLANGIIGIDFKKQTVTLYPRSTFDPAALGLEGLPLQLDDGVPRTDVSIEGVPGRFLVDTGSFSMLLYRDYARKLPSVVGAGGNRILTAGGAMRTSVVTVKDLIFGRVEFRSANAVEPDASTFDIMDYDGLIGRDVLHNFLCYFDYADGVLYVKPNL